MKKIPILICFTVLLTWQAVAKVTLPNIIGPHMVLQQKSSVKLWGWSDPNESITIKVGWDTTTYKARGNGGARWMVNIPTPQAGGPYTIQIIASNTIVLEDVMIGEVWVCGGQSNMEWSGRHRLEESIKEAPNANNTQIRFFYVPKSTSATPQDNTLPARWVVCNPDDMINFSAIGYFYGKELQSRLNSPIGLINSNWGGTPAETWTPEYVIDNVPLIKKGADLTAPAPTRPNTNANAYNAMIYPLTSYDIAGVIWYQGESNTNTYYAYRKLFTGMIDAWRAAWQKDFPFYFVQIAPYRYPFHNVGALLREKQTQVSKHERTGMVVVSDLVPDTLNIHPTKKVEVAHRLAQLALAENYGFKDVRPYSPQYISHSIQKDKVTISFSNTENGFMTTGKKITSFEVAGEDMRFFPAEASIAKNQIVVYSPSVPRPVAVRYGFHNTVTPDLFNKEGLPVNLFRTDDWEMDTSMIKK